MPFSAAEVAASPGYGTVEGHVYEAATGNPLYPATIMVEDYNTGNLTGEFSNYADGSFHIVVPDGTYRVGAHAPGYITAWYPNSCSKEDATPVTVTANQTVSAIDFQLAPGGSISGTVFNQWMGTEQNQVVMAWTADTQELVAWTFSNDYEYHGQYSLEDLPFDDYKVYVHGGANPQYVAEWYNDQSSYETADTTLLTAEAPDTGYTSTSTLVAA